MSNARVRHRRRYRAERSALKLLPAAMQAMADGMPQIAVAIRMLVRATNRSAETIRKHLVAARERA